ncbi:transmembrane protein 254 isoform X2 [Lingula anatina]|uniref:Transmembrane protein 254 n=1 Tax=Lingula anatina TaxID=7574 RepID=A0A1S3JYG2_LINAN|nr:transmembrane protein 254 isoform X1 [Lingula anatina]XP_013415438.1 transmembrane protein 254 isoform X2 [Lingula anatina]|eukprot:XP_013415436.1 transmembrane protein 254 isoform X1 [Lingula anatina]
MAGSVYFESPSIVWWILVPFGMFLTSVTYLSPESICYLGPLGEFARWLGTKQPGIAAVIFYGAWGFHIGEALYAVKACSDRGIEGKTKWKWVIQTFIMGVFSLSKLIRYNPKDS